MIVRTDQFEKIDIAQREHLVYQTSEFDSRCRCTNVFIVLQFVSRSCDANGKNSPLLVACQSDAALSHK